MSTRNEGPRIAGLADWRRLGAGGHATVFAATEEQFGRTVAVKVLHHVDAVGRRRFEREQVAMGQLSHPNIIVPYSSGYTEDGSPYLILEYLAGGSIADHVEHHGPVDWLTAIDWILPIVDALGHAHERSILHRDVKPENILLTADGVSKLADFGIAAVREVTATVTSISFTLAHAPPETFAGGEDLRDERADLYSLMSTLYSMIKGTAPFDRPGKTDSQLAYMARIADQPVTPLAEVPDSLNQIILESMAKRPDDRPPSAAALAERLDAARTSPSVITAGFTPTVRAFAPPRTSTQTVAVPPASPPSVTPPTAAPLGSSGAPMGRSSGSGIGAPVVAGLIAGGALVLSLIAAGGFLALRAGDDGPQTVTPEVATTVVESAVDETQPAAPQIEQEPLAEAEQLLADGDAAAALAAAETAAAAEPDDVDALVLQGQAHSALGDHDAALASLDAAAELDPDSADVLVEVAQAELAAAPTQLLSLDGGTDLGNGPSEMLLLSDDLWVAMSGQRSALRLDRDEPTQSTEIPLSRLPDHIVGDDEVVWSAASTDQQLWRIDPATDQATVAVTYPAYPAALTMDEQGRVFAVLWNEPDLETTVARFDPATGDLVVSEVLVGHAAPDILFAHGRLWISTFDGLSAVDPDTLAIVADVPIFGQARSIKANADYLFTDVRQNNQSMIVRVSPVELSVEELVPIDDGLVRIEATERHVFVLSRRGEIHVVATAAPLDETVVIDLGVVEINGRDVKIDDGTLYLTLWENPDATGGRLDRYQLVYP